MPNLNAAQFDLKASIGNTDALPAMPVIAQRLLALKLDTDEGEQQMLSLITQDTMISAKIIGLANAPMLRTARKITSIKEAALVLGLKRIRSVAMGIAIMSLMKKPAGRFNLKELWLHNLGVAFGMIAITRKMPVKMRPQEDQAFLAGMLHDIGHLALAYLDSVKSDALIDGLAAEPTRSSLDIERELLGVTHQEIGADLAQHWNLPEVIVAVLRYHHTPDLSDGTVGQQLAHIVYLTEKLLPSFSQRESHEPFIVPDDWMALGIDPNEEGEIVSRAAEQAEQAQQFAHNFL
jgi:HD-like signal output (HDOD) protein